MKTIVVYHPDFSRLGYPPLKERIKPAFTHLEEKGYLDRQGVQTLTPGPVPLEPVGRVHTPRHISDVESSGYMEVSLLSTGGVVEACRKISRGDSASAFCFVGAAGHHASREGFWGFCFLNDVAISACDLLDQGTVERLAIIDIDPHFGDGTRDILGPESRVLHVNFHSDFGSGGAGAGPTNIDISLPFDAGDDTFLDHAGGALERARDFGPDLLYIVFGHDSHRDDYGAFRLSLDAYRRFAVLTGELFPEKVCYVLSGGSDVGVAKEAIGSVVEVLSS